MKRCSLTGTPRPGDHQLVGMESRRRAFAVSLRRMVDQPAGTIALGCVLLVIRLMNTGWTHQATPEQLSVTTPTGHRYCKETGPVLEGIPPDKQVPPDKQPLPEVRLATDCYATSTQWTASLRVAA